MRILNKIKRFFNTTSNEKNGKVFINILTRTSGRPVGFSKCHSSILNQTYKNTRHIVSYDTKEDLDYLQSLKVDIIKVKRRKYAGRLARKGHKLNFEPYNLYCNRLLREVREGWVLFLDDDDMLAGDEVIAKIAEEIKQVEEDTLLIWRTRYPDGRKLPGDNAFKTKEIKYMDIDTACFTFHSKYRKSAKWDAWRGSDYRYIRDLSQAIPKQKWISEIITLKNNFGDQGNRNDLQQ